MYNMYVRTYVHTIGFMYLTVSLYSLLFKYRNDLRIHGNVFSYSYVLAHDTSKDKSPFLAVLDVKKNCWTDDEDDIGMDETSGLRDYGKNKESSLLAPTQQPVTVIRFSRS